MGVSGAGGWLVFVVSVGREVLGGEKGRLLGVSHFRPFMPNLPVIKM